MNRSLPIALMSIACFTFANAAWSEAASDVARTSSEQNSNSVETKKPVEVPIDHGSNQVGTGRLGDVPTEQSSNSSETNKPLNLSTQKSSFVLGTEEQVLAWRHWHERVERAISKRIKRKAIATKFFGQATLQVTVTNAQAMTATIVDSNDERLGKLCLDATIGLNGDPLLQFPSESKRKVVEFNIKYTRNLLSLPFDRFIKNDWERLNKDEMIEHK